MLWLTLLACNDFQTIAETKWVEPTFDLYYIEEAPPGIDIVMALDASGSMSNNWDNYYAQIPNLIAALPDTEWRITVISADPSKVEFQGWITPQDLNPEWSLIAQTQQIQNLQGQREEGFGASIVFADTYQDQLMTDNDLYWVFVSDEDEQSGLTGQQWRSLFGLYKTEPNTKVTAGVIVDTGKGCGDQPGDQYVEAATIVVDLCDPDYGVVMDPLRSRFAPSQDTFALSGTPTPDSIEVWSDADPVTDWDYSGATNTITVADPLPVPSTLIVTYYVE
jgi:hypothetical protein